MNEKKITEIICLELGKMLASGLISDEQHAIIADMVSRVTNKKEMPRVVYSEDGKRAFFNGHSFHLDKDGYYFRNARLHQEVWEFYNQESVPKGYQIHHNGKNKFGEFDKTKNDIEDLQLVSATDHGTIHNQRFFATEMKCEICGNTFKSFTGRVRQRCPECRTKGKILYEKICPYCHKTFTTEINKKKFCSKNCCNNYSRYKRKKLK